MLEMLYGVGDVGAPAVDPRLLQRIVEQLPGRPDKGAPGQILLIAGLFPDEHKRGVDRPFSEHRLGRVAVERAACATHRLLPQRAPGRRGVPPPGGRLGRRSEERRVGKEGVSAGRSLWWA